MLKKVLFTGTIILLFFGCSRKDATVNFYIQNVSMDNKRVGIKILLNDSVVLNRDFINSMVIPDFELFKLEYPKGKYILKVMSSTNVVKTDTINTTKKDAYVYVQYQERKPLDTPVAVKDIKRIELLVTNEKQKVY